jgi:uncharacterized membrane protein
MFYGIMADVVVFLHFLWIIFLIFGAFIGRRYKWIKRVHIAGLCFALTIQGFGWYCPLTYLEIWLRKMHDPSTSYSGSFIINYVQKIVYIELPAKVILIMTIFLVLMSAWLYLHKPKKVRT